MEQNFLIGDQPKAPAPKKRLMWISPSPLMQSSFGVVSHEILTRLNNYQTLFLGQNYYGSPRNFGNYSLVSYSNGAHLMYWMNLFKPDITVFYQSPPYIAQFNGMAQVIADKTKLVMYVPVEATLCQIDITPFYNKAKAIMVPSAWSQKCLKEQYGIQSEILYHGVDMGMFKPGPKPLDFAIGTIASNVWRKQLTRVVDAHLKVEQRGFRVPCYFVTSTYDASAWLPDMEKYIILNKSSVKLNEAAYMNLAQSQPEIAAFYNQIYVHMLTATEAFGVPNLEAMATGTVPLIVEHGASPEVVGDCGIHVKVAGYIDLTIGKVALVDVDDLAEKIIWAKTNPEKLQQLANKGLERARSFTWEAAAQKLDKILSKL